MILINKLVKCEICVGYSFAFRKQLQQNWFETILCNKY